MEGAVHSILSDVGWVLFTLGLIGCLYMVAATVTLRRFFARARSAPRRADGVTILKPLHGAEPLLADNLATFLEQDHDGPIQLLCGVQRPDDPAIAVVDGLRARFPGARIDLVVDATTHGANRKVANLINMTPQIAHDVIVLSDSDMVASPGYLAGILAALDRPGVGAVTIVYNGRGDAGFWSVMLAAGLSWLFTLGVVFGAAWRLARPCMGSTIAVRRGTLAAMGGFFAFADVLADDYAIGEAVAARGLTVAVPPMLVTHASTERDFGEMWRHELRWGATVREVAPVRYLLGVVAVPLPFALLSIAFHPVPGAVLAGFALLVRLAAAVASDRIAGRRTAPYWLLPLRDCLTLAVFIASLTVRSVEWRGATLRMEQHGHVSAAPEFPTS